MFSVFLFYCMYIFMIQPNLTIKCYFKIDKIERSHTPWRSSKYAKLVLVKTKNRDLKVWRRSSSLLLGFLDELLFQEDKVVHDPILGKVMHLRITPQHNQRKQLQGKECDGGGSWSSESCSKATCLQCYLYQRSVNIAELLFWCQKPITTSFQNSQNYEAYVKIMHTFCCMV